MSEQGAPESRKRVTQSLEDQAWAEIARASREAAAKKRKPRIALTNLDEPSIDALRDCFKQFGIDSVVVESEDGEFLRNEKFEACAIKLNSAASQVLEVARSSALNRHLVVYGISSNPVMILRLLKHGINAILDHPINPKAMQEVVRATHTVVKGEIRRFIRVPLLTLVTLKVDGEVSTAYSRQVSATGMAVIPSKPLAKGQALSVSFTLPNTQLINTAAVVCWMSEEDKMVGVRFDPPEGCIELIRPWIEEHFTLS
jgi:hypothetical protein